MKRVPFEGLLFGLAVALGCTATPVPPTGPTPALPTATATPPGPQAVAFAELVANPERYNGKVVRTSGIGLKAFESNALGEGTRQQGSMTYLTEPAIWLDWGAVTSKSECFTTQTIPPAEFCKVEVEGVFEHGAGYGHLDAYKYRIRKQDQS